MKENTWFRRYGLIVLAGVVVGVAALILTAAGNPKNMGFCIACFERDIAGALGLHGAGKVQYLRPEIPGIVLGAMLSALSFREFKARAGSCPASRFVLGLFVMIGALVFCDKLGLQKTLLATGTLYTFFDDGGALSLREAGAMVAEGVVGTCSLLTDYSYKTDIDQQTYNSIKLSRPNEATGRADVFQAMDSANIGRWGLLQLYQKVDTKLNDAQVEAQVRAMLKFHNRRFRTLKVQALGLLGLRAGQMLF